MRSFVLLASGMLLSGCAGAIPDVESADVPRLEREVVRAPSDPEAKVRLGMAQFKAGDYDESRASLRAAMASGHESGPALLYLGMVEEELEDWSAARDAYNRYLTVGASAAVRDAVRERLTLVGRSLARAETRQALTREGSVLGPAGSSGRTIAVMPLAFDSGHPELEPVIYALSDMMAADFQKVDALTVVDRTRAQIVLDEMALTSATYDDLSAAERAGVLLGADHVVTGVLTVSGDGRLQVEADVLDVARAGRVGASSAASRLEEVAAPDDLVAMEQELVIRTIREVLGLTLTSGQERAIRGHGADDVRALLAYGRGLRAMDHGDYDRAQKEFGESMSLGKGSVSGVSAMKQEASLMAGASRMSTAELAALAGTTGETRTGFFAPPSATTTDDLTSLGITSRAPVGVEARTAPASSRAALQAGTLRSVTEAVAPTPTALTLGLSSADESRNPAAKQTLATTREPLEEVLGGVVLPGLAQLQILMSTVRLGGDR